MKNSHKIRLLIGIIFICILIALRISGVSNYLGLTKLKEQGEILHLFVAHHYIVAVILFIALYITVVILSLPVSGIMTMTGGFLFGTVPGVVYSNIGATTGALCSFLLVRYLIGQWLQVRYKESLVHFNRAFEQYGTLFLLVIHFVAVVPFFMINFLASMTHVSLLTFVWTTSLGIIPAGLVYAFAGEQLATIDSIKDIFSANLMIAFLLLTLLAVLPLVVQKMRFVWMK